MRGRGTPCPYGGTIRQTKCWYITRNNLIAVAIRKDIIKRLSASLSSNIFDRWGVSPILQYTYTKRDSNIWSREYERHRLNLLFNYRF